MMYYIDKPYTWKAANRKCEEVQKYVETFSNSLVEDEPSLNKVISQIKDKVEELNKAYPRTKKLAVSANKTRISCSSESRNCDYDYVFTMDIKPVIKKYQSSGGIIVFNNVSFHIGGKQ